MGEKKEKTFLRRSAAAVEEEVWLTQKSSRKKG